MKKKILALLLALSMTVNYIPMFTIAQGDGTVDPPSQETQETQQPLALDTKQVLTCEAEEHTHGEGCRGELTCQISEAEGHTHDAALCGTEYNQICAQEQCEPHAHTGACLGDPAYTVTCTIPENHTHGDGCYEPVKELKCTLPLEAPHVHGDGCYITACTQDHEHTPECPSAETPALSCDKTVDILHTHDENTCFSPVLELVCTNEEEDHTHGDDCYKEKQDLICEIPENHTHGDPCKTPNILCTTPVTEGHTHNSDCFETVYQCGLEEAAAHSHTQDCYALTCEKTEHQHADGCYTVQENTESPTEPTEPAIDATADQNGAGLYEQLLEMDDLNDICAILMNQENHAYIRSLSEKELYDLMAHINGLEGDPADIEAVMDKLREITSDRTENLAGTGIYLTLADGKVVEMEENKTYTGSGGGTAVYSSDKLTLTDFVHKVQAVNRTGNETTYHTIISNNGNDITLNVVGNNQIAVTGTYACYGVCAFLSKGDVTITGTGSISFESADNVGTDGKKDGRSMGIYMDAKTRVDTTVTDGSDLTIEGSVTVTVKGGNARRFSRGIDSTGSLTVQENATLYAYSGDVNGAGLETSDISNSSCLVFSNANDGDNKITITDNARVIAVSGNVTANSAESGNSVCVSAAYGLTISGKANLTINAGSSLYGNSIGLNTNKGELTLSDSVTIYVQATDSGSGKAQAFKGSIVNNTKNSQVYAGSSTANVVLVSNEDAKNSETFTKNAYVCVESGFYDLWVGGMQITRVNRDDIGKYLADYFSDHSITGTVSGTATYAPATNTLTLNGLSFSCADVTYQENSYTGTNQKAAILAYGMDVTINVNGTNKVTNTDESAEQSIGIYVYGGDLTLTGSGTLEVHGGKGTKDSIGICVDKDASGVGGDLTIEMTGTVKSYAVNEAVSRNSYGMYVSNSATIRNGTVQSWGYAAEDTSFGLEVADGDFLMSGGTVTLYGGYFLSSKSTNEKPYRNCYALRVGNGKTEVTSGTLTATAGWYTSSSWYADAFGIWSKGSVNFTGDAKVTAKCDDTRGYRDVGSMAGLYAEGPISITSTKSVTIQCAKAKADGGYRYGIVAKAADRNSLYIGKDANVTVLCGSTFAGAVCAAGNVFFENAKSISITGPYGGEVYAVTVGGDFNINGCKQVTIGASQSKKSLGVVVNGAISITDSTVGIEVGRGGTDGGPVGIQADSTMTLDNAQVTVTVSLKHDSTKGDVIGVCFAQANSTLTLKNDSKLEVTATRSLAGNNYAIYMPEGTINVSDISWIRTTAGDAPNGQSKGIVTKNLVISGGIVEGQASTTGGIGIDFENDPIILPRGYAGCVGDTLDVGVWTLASDNDMDGTYTLPRSLFQNQHYGLITAGGLVPTDVHYVDADGTSHWVEYAFSMKYMKEKGVTTLGANVAYSDDSQHRSDFFYGVDWYLVDDDITYDDLLVVNGAINLILGSKQAEDYDVNSPEYTGYYTLTANKGIDVVYGKGADDVENEFHIWVQSHDDDKAGRLVSKDNIGGTENTARSDFIEINGGIIEVHGGIGSIHGVEPARVTINNAVVSAIGATDDYAIEASTLTVTNSVIFLNNYLATTEVWDNSILYVDADMTSLDTAVYYGTLEDKDGAVTLNHSHTLDATDILLVKNGQSLTMGKGTITNNGTIYVNYGGALTDVNVKNVYYQITDQFVNEDGEARTVDYSNSVKVIDETVDENARDYYGDNLKLGFHYAEDGVSITVTARDQAKLVISNTGIGVTNGSSEDVQSFTMPVAPVLLEGTVYERFDLTITTSGTNGADSSHSWIFTIVNEDRGIHMTVVLVGNETRIIKNLPYGTYVVTEQSDWSWRYEALASQNGSPDNSELKFAVTRSIFKWLDGYAWTKKEG